MTDLFGRADVDNQARRFEASQVDFGLRTRVYTYFLGELRLSLAHREALRDRGVDSEQQIRDGYRSLDQESGYLACRKLVEYFGTDSLLSVPGFWEENGEVYPTIKEGLAVPVLGLRGEVRAVQVRIGGRNVKYATLSGGPGGSVGSPCHVPIGAVQAILDGRPWAVTEGPIKANIATDRWMPTVGLLGALSFNPTFRLVDKRKPDKVVLAFDMDRYDKPGVLQAQDRLAAKLGDMGVDVSVAHWDDSFKGLDDALVAGQKICYDGVSYPRLRGGTN